MTAALLFFPSRTGILHFFPYLRIIPMQLTILPGGALGGHGPASLLFFLLLKTAADVAMHMLEHAARPGTATHTV